MRATVAAILLAIATGFTGWVYGTRAQMANPGPTHYHAALYSLHVCTVDATSGEPLDFDFRWPKDEVSPFSKGSGPTKIREMADGSKTLALVGLYRPQGLEVRIEAKGYASVPIHVESQSGGIGEDGPERMQTVTLTPVIAAAGDPGTSR